MYRHRALRSTGHYHVRSAGHYILQLGHMHRPEPAQPQLLETQEVPAQMLQLGPPLFKLAGLAIGNGLTDPKLQVMLLPFLLQVTACASLDKQKNLINMTNTENTEKKQIL